MHLLCWAGQGQGEIIVINTSADQNTAYHSQIHEKYLRVEEEYWCFLVMLYRGSRISSLGSIKCYFSPFNTESTKYCREQDPSSCRLCLFHTELKLCGVCHYIARRGSGIRGVTWITTVPTAGVMYNMSILKCYTCTITRSVKIFAICYILPFHSTLKSRWGDMKQQHSHNKSKALLCYFECKTFSFDALERDSHVCFTLSMFSSEVSFLFFWNSSLIFNLAAVEISQNNINERCISRII